MLHSGEQDQACRRLNSLDKFLFLTNAEILLVSFGKNVETVLTSQKRVFLYKVLSQGRVRLNKVTNYILFKHAEQVSAVSCLLLTTHNFRYESVVRLQFSVLLTLWNDREARNWKAINRCECYGSLLFISIYLLLVYLGSRNRNPTISSYNIHPTVRDNRKLSN